MGFLYKLVYKTDINAFFKRRLLQKLKFKRRGVNVVIGGGWTIAGSENISLGNHVYVGESAFIWGSGGLQIDDNVIIGPRVTIITINHNYENAKAIPYDEKVVSKPIHICSHVWIGANVSIVPGVTIGEGAVVAMSSVVADDVEPLAIVGGNPATVLKYRSKEKFEELKKEGRFYLELKKNGKISTNHNLQP